MEKKLTSSLKSKIDESLSIIRGAISTSEKSFVACSYGHDSILTFILCRKIFPNIKTVFVNSKTEYPDVYAFRELVTKKYSIQEVTLKSKHNFFWVVKRHGFPLYSKGNLSKYNRKYLSAHYCCLYIKQRPLQQWCRKEKVIVLFDGLRKEESLLRRYWLNKNGLLTYSKMNKCLRCHPVGNFSYSDVQETLKHFKVPQNKIYTKTLKGFTPRTGCWCCTLNWKRRSVWLRKFYPKLWKTLILSGLGKQLLTLKGMPDVKPKDVISTRPCIFDKF